MIDRLSAYLMEIPEMPHPPAEYRRFAEQRNMWNLLGATSSYDDMTWAEVQEAMCFAALEQQHPQRFKKADR